MSDHSYKIVPDFIQGIRGKLYTLHYTPSHIDSETECFVIAPAFAEEMNRCRYMCTMFAQAIAKHGYGFFSVDTYGTGDSEGDFREANWDQTCNDLLTATEYVSQLGYKKISILGIRLGVLQAMQVAESVPDLHRLLFWQPVISGQAALTQFLRIRIAASLSRDETAGTTKEFEELVNRGECVEVSGYELSPGMFKGMKNAKLEAYSDFTKARVGWFTAIASEERKPPRVESIAIEKWRKKGANIDYSIVVGPPYWQVHERTLAPGLITATVDYITGKHTT